MQLRTTLHVPTIVCGGCANGIKKALGGVQGLSHVDVDINTKMVMVDHDEQLSRDAIVEALDRAGYTADGTSN